MNRRYHPPMTNPTGSLQRIIDLELAWCLRFNRVTQQHGVERLFALVSRLGDGIFWYSLMACLLIAQGRPALPAVGRMIVASVIGLILYKWLKTRTTRARPYACNSHIRVPVTPLDQYSFPSGHTLHAVAFSVVAVFHYPRLIWLLLPFTMLVALSRVILGLHYPSDVVAGALLGAGLSTLALQL